MRMPSILGTLLVGALAASPAFAQDPDTKALEERIKKLEESLKTFEEHEKRERERYAPSTERPTPGTGPMPAIAPERPGEEKVPLSFGSTGSGRLIYAKPFVASPKAFVGGYADLQFRSSTTPVIENGYGGTASTFDQQRFVPFIYADITDRIKFASEIEFEHGIRETSDSEISLEFVNIDYLFHEAINLRAGIILMPIGKFNLLHDSPLNDLTDRPLVSTLIIPTTMAETGAGFYGTFYPSRLSKMDYEVYVTTGPCGYNNDPFGQPLVNEQNGTRSARQRKCPTDDGFDINNGQAVVGRVAFSPVLGVEVAGSGYYGNAAPSTSGNYNPLSIVAVDWTLQRGPFELIGEAAWSYMRNNSRAINNNALGVAPGSLLTGQPGNSAPGIPPQRMSGYYIQGNYHFMPELLMRLAPSIFTQNSTFTAVLRWDQVNTNLDMDGGFGDLQQLSFGLNFRPIEDTVFKVSYQLGMEAFNPNTDQRVHNNTFVASVATYF